MKTKYKWILIAVVVAVFLAIYLWPRPIGYIKIDANDATATLQISRSLLSKSTVTSGAKPSVVRAGLYRTQRLQIRGEQNGNTYQIESRKHWNIKVKNNETTALRLGPPLLVKPNVTSRGSLVLIDFSIIGQAGEQYGNVIKKNGRTASTPELKIIDEAEKTLAAGKFEYG